MNAFVAVLCSLLLSLSLGTAWAGTDIDGFQGMRWGSSLNDLQRTKKLVLTKENDGSGGSLYALQNEKLRFGTSTLTGIHCSFVQGRLQGVILLFSGLKNFAAIKAEATTRYGQPIKIDQRDGEMYSWPGTLTSIVLSCNRNAASGFLFFSSKKQLNKASAKSKSAPPKPSAPQPVQAQPQPSTTDNLALFDEASNSPTLQAQPSQPDSSQEGITADAVISPFIQERIDRDQALTRLCWDTLGPTADQACAAMQENARLLQEQGWCMRPGEAKDGLQVIWSPCGDQQPPATTALPSTSIQPSPSTWIPPENPRSDLCRLVAELFAATATMREEGRSPLEAEEALQHRQGSQSGQLNIEHIRETVELVYFDQQYRTIPLAQLPGLVEGQCLAGQGPYIQPLP